MAEVRACVYLLVLLVISQRTLGSPSESDWWCDLNNCDNNEDDDDSSFGFYDILLYIFDPCEDCEQSPAAPGSHSPATPAEAPSETETSSKPQKINLSIPPANGVNITLQNSGTSWWLNLVPWLGGGSTPSTTEAPAAASTTPAANGTAGNDTAA